MLLLSSLSLLELLLLVLLEEDDADDWCLLLFDFRDDLLALLRAFSAALSMQATASGICSRLVAKLGTGFILARTELELTGAEATIWA